MRLRFEMSDVDDALCGLEEEALLGAASRALRPGLEAVAREARANCPVRTGALRESIGVRMGGDAAGEVFAAAPHAVPVEMGTARMPARPYLYPAFKARQSGLTERIARAVIRCAQSGGREI